MKSSIALLEMSDIEVVGDECNTFGKWDNEVVMIPGEMNDNDFAELPVRQPCD